MKLSNLILTFILALIASFSLHSQSNSVREIKIENDEESIYIKYENGDLMELVLDGETIPKKDYNKHETLIAKYAKDAPSPPTPPTHSDTEMEVDHDGISMQTMLNAKLSSYLREIDAMNSTNYKLKLTPSYVKLNGKKLDREILIKCLAIFEQTAGYELNTGSFFKVKITPKSRSISLSIED
jgi:hypothetical protein